MPILRALLIIAAAFTGAASALGLSSSEVDRFLNVAEALHEFDDDFTDIDIDVDEDNIVMVLEDFIDDDGNVTVVGFLVDDINANSDARKVFRKALREERLSEDEFVEIGDALVMAIIRSEIDNDDLRNMRKAGELDGLKDIPGVGEVLERLELFADALDDVSRSDVRIAEDAMERLEAL